MAYPDQALRGLLQNRASQGKLTWIGVRPSRGATMLQLDSVEVLEDRGLAGDRTSEKGSKKRQISLMQAEHLPVIAALAGRDDAEPGLLRRNLVISGISVLAFRAAQFRIGEVLFEGTGTCDPCSKMERALGLGGYNAMRGHGGVLARAVTGGVIRLGDPVDFVR